MDKIELEGLKDEELFELQNSISEVIKQRNLKKGDVDEIIDSAFNVGFPKMDAVGLNPWVEGSLKFAQEQELINLKQGIFVNLLLLMTIGHGNLNT